MIWLTIIIFACEKGELTDTITVEGILRDDASKAPIAGIVISIDGIKSPSGMGIITDGRRKSAGRTTTDANGYFKVKLKIFKGAERLEFYLNPGKQKEGYVDRQENIYLSDINRNGNSKLNFTLSPTAVLRIKFKNISPVSDSDFFYFGWYAKGNGWTRGILQKENCGTIAASEALTWTGKEVCGIFTLETIAEQKTFVYWTVKKSGLTNQYKDSVFIKRGEVNEFSLNY